MELVAGCDEVGRGALAGPLVAAAVLVRSADRRPSWLPARRDSKLLSARRRAQLAELARETFCCSLGVVGRAELDELGVGAANRLAIYRAVASLPARPSRLVVDYVAGFRHELPTELVVAGDVSRWPVALASIVAKVHRDLCMLRLAEIFPGYQLHRNAGYGTAQHLAALAARGPSACHRLSFAPCRGQNDASAA